MTPRRHLEYLTMLWGLHHTTPSRRLPPDPGAHHGPDYFPIATFGNWRKLNDLYCPDAPIFCTPSLVLAKAEGRPGNRLMFSACAAVR